MEHLTFSEQTGKKKKKSGKKKKNALGGTKLPGIFGIEEDLENAEKVTSQSTDRKKPRSKDTKKITTVLVNHQSVNDSADDTKAPIHDDEDEDDVDGRADDSTDSTHDDHPTDDKN